VHWDAVYTYDWTTGLGIWEIGGDNPYTITYRYHGSYNESDPNTISADVWAVNGLEFDAGIRAGSSRSMFDGQEYLVYERPYGEWEPRSDHLLYQYDYVPGTRGTGHYYWSDQAPSSVFDYDSLVWSVFTADGNLIGTITGQDKYFHMTLTDSQWVTFDSGLEWRYDFASDQTLTRAETGPGFTYEETLQQWLMETA
jgi:hypothetical protein